MEEEIEFTQVQIDKKLRDFLAEKGKKLESFDEIIKRLIKYEEIKK